ncbi:PAS domain-containing sensor histidine kinase [Hymenobacter sp. ISL-91]|uniref:PAS domain-containing sensor histidine kinase n=1 Tax=Hymenobacter sp. ISL-91 TaxID=2819151 RepID=UPI001BED1CFF|nr:PAS domain-containing sensor histidine kinase [Hymenobacter sp. ISL-91]MBT2557070.1 PAS domain-containing sensor histidine kinase [Hymenobacter sp. ISL-91]
MRADSDPTSPTPAQLARENEELRQQLFEAEELLTAIRTGSIDALAVQGPEGPRIFTLEGADQSYRTLIEQMNEGALLLSPDATVLYCNACLAGLLEAPLETMMGNSFSQFVPADFREYWHQLVANGWAGKSKGEMPLLTAGGRLRPVALALNVLGSAAEAPVLAVIATDVSARREISVIRARVMAQNALLELQQQELRVQAQAAAETSRILEGIPHVTWTADPQGLPTYLNRHWYDYTGQPPAVRFAPGSTLSYLHPDDLPSVLQSWREAIANGQGIEVECRILSAQGHYRWMLGRIRPSRNEAGELVQWIGTYTDMHDQKLALARVEETRQELRDNNAQLIRINADLDNFIYTASHDLRSPITNIEGLLETLNQELPAEQRPDAVEPVLRMMQDSVDRFKRTIENLTDISKLQKDSSLPRTPVALAPLIEDVRLDLQPLIQTAEGELEVAIEECATVVLAEKNLRSIVYNLLSNAFKYHHPARPARVRLHCGPAEPGFIALQVHDNGLGLDLREDRQLFTMFQRLHDHVEGSGIGLYMVKKIAENAGGRVAVESRLGEGSVFTVFLPE